MYPHLMELEKIHRDLIISNEKNTDTIINALVKQISFLEKDNKSLWVEYEAMDVTVSPNAEEKLNPSLKNINAKLERGRG